MGYNKHNKSNSCSSILRQSYPATTKEQRTRHRRRVSFNSMAEVCEIEYLMEAMLNDGNDENIDPSELWWSPLDYKNNKRRCQHEARRRMYQSRRKQKGSDNEEKTNDDDYYDCRGLERMMDGGECKALVFNAVHAVRREQARHQLDGVFEDSDLILAKVYEAYCVGSAIQAERLGRLDALVAREALGSDWETSSTSTKKKKKSKKNKRGGKSSAKLEAPVSRESCNNENSRASVPVPNSNSANSSINIEHRGREQMPSSPSSCRQSFFALTNMMNRRRTAWI